MSDPETSFVRVDISQEPQCESLPPQHSFDFCITSTQDGIRDADCTQQQHHVDDTVDGQSAGSSSSCDTGNGSVYSDDETADEDERDGTSSRPDVACYKHFVSTVQSSSPLSGYIK